MGWFGKTFVQKVQAVLVPQLGDEPIGTAMNFSLGIAGHTLSPMNDGVRSFATHDIGAGLTGADHRRTGALQQFRGAGADQVNGIKGDPAAGSPTKGMSEVTAGLALMSMPYALPNPKV